MDPFGLVSIGAIYVALQVFSIMRLEGMWLRAAIMTVPVLCALLVISVSLGLFGIPGAELGAFAAVPLGIFYLGILLPAAQVARFFRPSTN
ncbi:MAG: hypothetical protein KJO30_02715 [Boseongicola sp.]|jgi:hypothetical protein|nr:hypothetical protein [Boseongicola sp.]NNJ69467.1 hypothetical protein [Boseongicola sp.]